MIIDIIIRLIIFLDADIHLIFIDDFSIIHMFIDEIFEYFSCFFSQV